jgi:hypothetical protein
MTNRTKLFVFALAAVLRLAATPALAQSFDADEGVGNALPISRQPVAAESYHAAVHTARRNGMDSYAMEPRQRSNSAPGVRMSMPVDSDDPALTGGGSIGYNKLLKQEGD